MHTQSNPWGRAIWAAALVALVARALAFSPYAIGYADEWMQYLEQANRLATGQGIVPWEYRYGARNALIPQLLAGPVWLGHWLAPGTHLAMLMARGVFAGFGALALWAAWRLGRVAGRPHALIALLGVALWWECGLFGSLMLSESIGAALMLGAAAALLGRRDALAGLLLGLGVLARLQYGLFGAVLALGALRGDGQRWLRLMAGAAVALAVGALSDLALGRVPYRWVLVNLSMNMGGGAAARAARFGTEPAGYYLRMLVAHWGVALLPMLWAAIWAGWRAGEGRYRPLLVAALVNLAAHSLIAHKEYRFVWVSVLVLVVLAGVGVAETALRRWPGSAGASPWRWLAAGVAGWGLVTAYAQGVSGGFAAMRGGDAITLGAVQAADRPGVCGVAVANQWRAHVVPSVMARSLPLSVIPDGGVLPMELAGAANALVAPARPVGAEAYAEVACRAMPQGRACLYVRSGGCSASPYYSYQATLGREDL